MDERADVYNNDCGDSVAYFWLFFDDEAARDRPELAFGPKQPFDDDKLSGFKRI